MKKVVLTITLLAVVSTMFVACEKEDDGNEPKQVVDLGLPSGILWATCNVGATNPWKSGDYFAWGETTTNSKNNWKTYSFCKGTDKSLTKYCSDAEFGNDGFCDTLNTLEVCDDAASANWGNDWTTPTAENFQELYNECYWVWTNNYSNKGVYGYIIYKAKEKSDRGAIVYSSDGMPSESYSLNDAHIFLPAVGYREDMEIFGAEDDGVGFYWTVSLNADYPSDALSCCFSGNNVNVKNSGGRRSGMSVRPVKRP